MSAGLKSSIIDIHGYGTVHSVQDSTKAFDAGSKKQSSNSVPTQKTKFGVSKKSKVIVYRLLFTFIVFATFGWLLLFGVPLIQKLFGFNHSPTHETTHAVVIDPITNPTIDLISDPNIDTSNLIDIDNVVTTDNSDKSLSVIENIDTNMDENIEFSGINADLHVRLGKYMSDDSRSDTSKQVTSDTPPESNHECDPVSIGDAVMRTKLESKFIELFMPDCDFSGDTVSTIHQLFEFLYSVKRYVFVPATEYYRGMGIVELPDGSDNIIVDFTLAPHSCQIGSFSVRIDT